MLIIEIMIFSVVIFNYRHETVKCHENSTLGMFPQVTKSEEARVTPWIPRWVEAFLSFFFFSKFSPHVMRLLPRTKRAEDKVTEMKDITRGSR